MFLNYWTQRFQTKLDDNIVQFLTEIEVKIISNDSCGLKAGFLVEYFILICRFLTPLIVKIF